MVLSHGKTFEKGDFAHPTVSRRVIVNSSSPGFCSCASGHSGILTFLPIRQNVKRFFLAASSLGVKASLDGKWEPNLVVSSINGSEATTLRHETLWNHPIN